MRYYDFSDGLEVSDERINNFLQQTLEKLLEGNDYYYISTGDTFVTGFKYADDLLFIVSNNAGFTEIHLDISEKTYPKFEYRRNK